MINYAGEAFGLGASNTEMHVKAIYTAAVRAVTAWTIRALELHTRNEFTTDSIHTAAVAVASEWIHAGLAHVTHRDDCDRDSHDEPVKYHVEINEVFLGLDLLQSLAVGTVETAVHHALAALQTATTSSQDPPEIHVATLSGCARSSDFSIEEGEHSDLQTSQHDNLERTAASLGADCRDFASIVAHRFVVSVVEDTIRHYAGHHVSTLEIPVERQASTLRSGRGCKTPSERLVVAALPQLSRHPSPDDIPPSKLAKRVARPPKNNTPSVATALSPLASLPKTANRPPKNRVKHTSPRPVSYDRDDSESPPRLKKLEEYLDLHPIDQARRAYRPRRHQHHDQSTLHIPALSQNGYDAEELYSESDEPHCLPHLHDLRLPRSLPESPVKVPSTVHRLKQLNTPIDRPDRLGLLNKPKKRSGFCQQCVFEGRPCKISDCLKHQALR